MSTTPASDINPALIHWDGPMGLPEFARIDDGDFAAAFAAALPAHLAEIDAITNDPATPTFENTIVALERVGEMYSRVSGVFWNLSGANTNDTLQELERQLSPELSRHHSMVMMNAALFVRIDALYQDRDNLGLDSEAARVLELTWKSFVRSGA
ncbi:MAG: peptidase M3, partial [Rhodospirillaceae bacterium]|nr:peptidase M3 [Rhodospirillaceae bacterium]